MGALRATVSIRGREIDILFSHIEFSRKTDNKGRPVTSVIGGRLTFSIEATKDTEILEAMVNSQFKPVSGKIIFYKTDDNSIFNSFGQERFNLKQEIFKSEKPLTREAQKNLGVYKLTVTPTANMVDDAAGTAYALKTTDAFGNDIISKYDVKIKTKMDTEYLADNTSKSVKYTEEADLDELFADELKVVADYYFEVKDEQLKNSGATFDKETNTINATKKGSVGITIHYLSTKGEVKQVNATVHFKDISGEDLSIAPVSYSSFGFRY